MKKYSKTRIDKIKKDIAIIIAKAKGVGLRFTKGDWGTTLLNCEYFYPNLESKYRWATEDGCVCVAGAILLIKQPKVKDGTADVEAVAKALNVSSDFVNGFIHAYDLDNPYINRHIYRHYSAHYIQGYEIGSDINKTIFNRNTNAK